MVPLLIAFDEKDNVLTYIYNLIQNLRVTSLDLKVRSERNRELDWIHICNHKVF